MIDFNNNIRARTIASLVFAVLAGTSAVSMAIAPAILHI
jgi:hypothetical protein